MYVYHLLVFIYVMRSQIGATVHNLNIHTNFGELCIQFMVNDVITQIFQGIEQLPESLPEKYRWR